MHISKRRGAFTHIYIGMRKQAHCDQDMLWPNAYCGQGVHYHDLVPWQSYTVSKELCDQYVGLKRMGIKEHFVIHPHTPRKKCPYLEIILKNSYLDYEHNSCYVIFSSIYKTLSII
jgi:hypothetical protein